MKIIFFIFCCTLHLVFSIHILFAGKPLPSRWAEDSVGKVIEKSLFKTTGNKNGTTNVDLAGHSIADLGGIEWLDISNCFRLLLDKNKIESLAELLKIETDHKITCISLAHNNIRQITVDELDEIEVQFPDLLILDLTSNPLDSNAKETLIQANEYKTVVYYYDNEQLFQNPRLINSLLHRENEDIFSSDDSDEDNSIEEVEDIFSESLEYLFGN